MSEGNNKIKSGILFLNCFSFFDPLGSTGTIAFGRLSDTTLLLKNPPPPHMIYFILRQFHFKAMHAFPYRTNPMTYLHYFVNFSGEERKNSTFPSSFALSALFVTFFCYSLGGIQNIMKIGNSDKESADQRFGKSSVM